MTMYYNYIESPIGQLLLTANGDALTGVYMNEHKNGVGVGADWVARVTPVIAEATRQLREYFAGARKTFDLPVTPPEGTAFQRMVWRELCNIPFGETITYGELARRLGNANASRAVGAANGRNPVSIIVPCHRVIGASGKLTGYAGGETRKALLLALERGENNTLSL
ncbi:MAG: methylated-DNA--[protein]-cysteine S-methyltransferase [Akkermansiaceae bacterium]|nr:methylated-DNA--[protein]-cysteine S-methyltransferase [Armatimonadota bacterium]